MAFIKALSFSDPLPEKAWLFIFSGHRILVDKELGDQTTADQAALNSGLLKRLSEETGGRYYTPDNSRTLPEDISYANTGSSRLEEKDLWDMPFLFLLLVGLASAEWVLRKRKGLA